jgi:hypothetical protein
LPHERSDDFPENFVLGLLIRDRLPVQCESAGGMERCRGDAGNLDGSVGRFLKQEKIFGLQDYKTYQEF